MPHTPKRTVIIVDAYSTGRFLAPAFAEHGLPCVHVQSTQPIPPVLAPSYSAADFAHNLVWPACSNESQGLDRLQAFQPIAVIAGSETGVELADRIAGALQLPGNSTASSNARRDKFAMQEALAQRGLRAIPRIVTDESEAFVEWRRSELRGGPIVLKPLRSAGSEDVFFCRTDTDVRSAFSSIHGKEDALGSVNDKVLGQQLMCGTEYIVNTVSCRGLHCVTDVWRCRKVAAGKHGRVHALEELIDPSDDDEALAVVDYTLQAVSALGIEYGPAHSELIVDCGNVYLVELGARLQGAVVPETLRIALGTTSIDKVLECYLKPDSFSVNPELCRSLEAAIFRIFLICHVGGLLRATPGLQKVASLLTYHSHKFYGVQGKHIRKTIDYFTSPGLVHLVHADRAILERDYQEIRDLEKSGMYDLAPSSRSAEDEGDVDPE